jgi:glycerophosphoryl diester phosphodiesterase
MSRNKPKIYAHRGASKDFPEHTRRAYEGAIEQGADGFECDVRLTKDGVPVLWHDSDMTRNANYPGLIANLTLKEIQGRYPQIMTLGELIDLAIENKKDLAIETKHPVPTGRDIERVVKNELLKRKESIAKSGIEISMMSFSWSAIEVFKGMNLNINTVMLLNERTSKLRRRFTSAETFGPGIKELKKNPDLVRDAKEKGKRTFVWTVDQPEDVLFCAKIGVDVVITNKPGQARKLLGYP